MTIECSKTFATAYKALHDYAQAAAHDDPRGILQDVDDFLEILSMIQVTAEDRRMGREG